MRVTGRVSRLPPALHPAFPPWVSPAAPAALWAPRPHAAGRADRDRSDVDRDPRPAFGGRSRGGRYPRLWDGPGAVGFAELKGLGAAAVGRGQPEYGGNPPLIVCPEREAPVRSCAEGVLTAQASGLNGPPVAHGDTDPSTGPNVSSWSPCITEAGRILRGPVDQPNGGLIHVLGELLGDGVLIGGDDELCRPP